MARSRRKHSRSSNWAGKHLPKILLAMVTAIALAAGGYFATRQSPEDHLEKGLALYKSGDMKGAAIELKNALQGLPNQAEARFTLGKIHFAANNFPDADKEFAKARELDIEDPALFTLHARTLISMGEPKRLLDEFPIPDKADAPLKATLHALRARAQLMLKEPEAAEASLAQAEALAPGQAETLISRALQSIALGHSDAALPLVQQALTKAPDRADFWLLQGDLQRKLKQNADALISYGNSIKLDPNTPQALLARAQIHLDNAELDKAEPDIQAALKIAPQDILGRYFKAFIAFRHNNLAEANSLLQDLLRNAPGFMPAHLLAGTVSVGLGNKEAARFHLDKVLAVAPQHPLARKMKAATLADLGDLDTARQLLSSFGNDADDPTLNLMRGQIALRQGKYEEAVGYLRKAPASAQQDAKFLTDLAAGMMGSGDKAGAIEALTKAAALETESARPDVYLILAHVREKRYDKALEAVENLAKDKPNDPVVHNLRASILLSQNKPEQARPHLLKALEINPGYYPAAYNLANLDFQKNDLQSARNRMLQVAKANPKESRAWIMLAQIDASAGKEADVLSHLERAKNANEKDTQARLQLIQYWLRKNDPGKALIEARSALDTTGRVEFNEFIGLAQAALKDHTNARATFIKWAEDQPKNPKAHFRLAQEWIKANDLGRALQSLDAALALHPAFVEAAASKAQLLGKMNRSAEGIRIAKELQDKYPKSSVGYLAQADILYTQKQYASAAPVFAKASSLDGQTSSVLRAAQAYTLADQADAAQSLLGQWLSSHPQDAYARHEYALSLLNARLFPQAVAQYRQIVRDHPTDVTAYNNLAWLLGELKDKDAVPVAERALKLNPESPALQDTLGWILVRTGQVSRGLPLLEKAHAKQPTAAEIHWHYAYALAQAGKTDKAKRELEKLIFSDRQFPQKIEAKALLDRL